MLGFFNPYRARKLALQDCERFHAKVSTYRDGKSTRAQILRMLFSAKPFRNGCRSARNQQRELIEQYTTLRWERLQVSEIYVIDRRSRMQHGYARDLLMQGCATHGDIAMMRVAATLIKIPKLIDPAGISTLGPAADAQYKYLQQCYAENPERLQFSIYYIETWDRLTELVLSILLEPEYLGEGRAVMLDRCRQILARLAREVEQREGRLFSPGPLGQASESYVRSLLQTSELEYDTYHELHTLYERLKDVTLYPDTIRQTHEFLTKHSKPNVYQVIEHLRFALDSYRSHIPSS